MLSKLFKNRYEWRSWLEENHDKETEIWLVYYKVKVEKESIKYKEAVEEALCFGWIDSTVKRIDGEKHMQRFTPRKVKSNWSAINKERVSRLTKEGLMTEFGLKAIEIAKQNGSWLKPDSIDIRLETAQVLIDAFVMNQKAEQKFKDLTPSRKKQFIWWIESAKREETKEKRIKETIRLLLEQKRPGE